MKNNTEEYHGISLGKRKSINLTQDPRKAKDTRYRQQTVQKEKQRRTKKGAENEENLVGRKMQDHSRATKEKENFRNTSRSKVHDENAKEEKSNNSSGTRHRE